MILISREVSRTTHIAAETCNMYARQKAEVNGGWDPVARTRQMSTIWRCPALSRYAPRQRLNDTLSPHPSLILFIFHNLGHAHTHCLTRGNAANPREEPACRRALMFHPTTRPVARSSVRKYSEVQRSQYGQRTTSDNRLPMRNCLSNQATTIFE